MGGSPENTAPRLIEKSHIDRDYDAETSRGYHDRIALLNKVVEYGDAPEGDYQDLLDEPWGMPLGDD